MCGCGLSDANEKKSTNVYMKNCNVDDEKGRFSSSLDKK